MKKLIIALLTVFAMSAVAFAEGDAPAEPAHEAPAVNTEAPAKPAMKHKKHAKKAKKAKKTAEAPAATATQ